MIRLGVARDPAESAVILRRNLATALVVLVLSAFFFSWQLVSLSETVGQFTKYGVMARQYLSGTAQPERLLDFSPLYLGLHILAAKLWGDPGRAILGIHVALLSMTAALLFGLIRRRVGVGLSLAGVAAFVLGRSVLIYGHVHEPEPLMIFLLTALVFFVERRHRFSVLAAGTAMILCLLTRPSFAPLLLLVPLYYLIVLDDRRRAKAAIALFLVPVLLGGLLISYRNYRLQGRFSLLFMSPGTVFFDGNNPLSSGSMAVYPPVVLDMTAQFPEEADYQHAIYRMLARTVTGRNLSLGEANGYWSGKAMNYIRDYPGHFLTRTGRRIFQLFHRYRWHDLFDAWSADRDLGRLRFLIPFAPVSALALLGLILGLPAWRAHFLPYAIFANQAAVMALTYSTDRQRVSLYPFFVFFAVLALPRVRDNLRRRGAILIAVLPLTLLFSWENNFMRDETHNWEGYTRAGVFRTEAERAMAQADYPLALDKYAEATALSPSSIAYGKPARFPFSVPELADEAAKALPSLRHDSASTRLDKALLLIRANRLDEADQLLTALQRDGDLFQRDDNRLSDPAYYLGRTAFLRGQRERATDFMGLALRAAPGDPSVLAQMACLTGDQSFADRIFRYFDDVDAVFYLGRGCLETGRFDMASAYLDRIGEYLPGYERGQYYRAAALGAIGRYQQSAILYLAATGGRPGSVDYEEIFLPVFERWAADGSLEARYWYGVLLREYGYFRESAAVLAEAANAGHPGAQRELQELATAVRRLPR